MMKKIAVVFGTKGGMSDVGKFVAMKKDSDPNVEIKVIAMSKAKLETSDLNLTVDVADKEDKAEAERDLQRIKAEIIYVDVDDATAKEKIEASFEGVDAVVSCIGNRQPSMARYCGPGTELIVAAMKEKQVNRLVCLSSMGIGDDFLPTSGISVLWSCLLHTILRSARRDLYRMETAVCTSELDYLVVRPVGLEPTCKPKGTYKPVESRSDNKIDILIAKKDAAKFMFDQAISPTFHRTAVSIGHPPK